MGKTQTIPNGHPHGSSDVKWGREVATTVTSILAILLTILCLVVGAVVYNAKEFAAAADDRTETKIKLGQVEGEVKTLSSHLSDLIEKANETHKRTDERIDDLEHWRNGQTLSTRRGTR